ncbi:histidine phosphatase family protein [Pseudomonas guariconensis]|uniref:histidine phosphatase family protein n=1 Tax=Pseudomonas TaxID=286 RepID=UPI001CE427F5|nr:MULTISPECIES: histidine phosphatase family protein [Pseudomonas]MCO7642327.1 histidine phosphatase family protein [Pseudomonas sp. S 311-6]MCO7517192.1 histidine phosphatase family protein [Pseudomonas putida]MCO7567320.1 histidine phosphatase family protein [Pseudomonas mosselii]MCO7597182.1 histidine phosphatase family protein [Pseudomonas guariconensis]MCO7607469.1 histidine phosphatase family protein [Pseudomonas guariconensis]
MKLPLFLRRRRHLLLGVMLTAIGVPLALEAIEGRAEPVDGTQTLVFLRHAEKPGEGLGQLNCQGLNRALDLATLLPERFGEADYVFAANPSRHVEEGSQDRSYSYIRPLMTISPSAIRLGLPVNIDFGANDTDDLAEELMRDKYRNATVYTAWSHGYLPDLINAVAGKALGEERVITEDWSGDDFDTLYVLTLTWRDGKASLLSRNVRQGLDDGVHTCPS